ncbi:alpha-2 adrenergic receptor [Trichonephila clavipes]|nr:alpha-2 adrenergic receptor [Trichonephila clavipes]
MKIGNNGNLALGPFDESTPCLMIVLMNCQTKLRINHLTAVKSVAILEREWNGGGTRNQTTGDRFDESPKRKKIEEQGSRRDRMNFVIMEPMKKEKAATVLTTV